MKMKPPLASFTAAIALLLTAATARAEFETWKNKDGKAAELEITGVEEAAAGTQVLFRTKAGKDVVFKLEDLAGDDQARAKAWKPASSLKANFAYAKKRSKLKGPNIQFVFDLKPGTALRGPLEVSNVKATVGGKELEVGKWLGVVSDGISDFDPFSDAPVPTKPEWTLKIIAEGEFGDVAVEDCEFSADVEVACGKSPKEITASFPLPQSVSSEDDLEKTVDPITMKLESMSGPNYKNPGKKGRNGGDMSSSVLTGYRITAGKASAHDDGTPFSDPRPVFHQAFVVKGKEYPNTIDKDKATDPLKVVVKYWSETYNVPLSLTKAASNKGRKPPADTGDGAAGGGKSGGAGGGGSDPFEE